MNRETLQMKGFINLKLFDKTGKLKTEVNTPNVITTVGKTFLAAWLAAASQANPFMNYIALGTGTAAASAGDTTLDTEIGSRVAGTITSATATWQNQATFGAGVSTGAITEAGIFSAAAAGTMLARQVFSVINKAAGDSLQVTWQVTFS